MDELIAFLLARLDAQEAQAQRELEFIQVAVNRDRSDHRRRVDPDRDDGARTVSPWTQREITRAEWMLADVAAKRAILARAVHTYAVFNDPANALQGLVSRREKSHAVATFHDLALPYADHPDFQAEWRTA